MKKVKDLKGLSFMLAFGRYGGFYVSFTDQSWRLCLGWVAFTIVFCDIEAFISLLLQEKESNSIPTITYE